MQEKVKQSENQEITSDATEETIEAVHAEVEEAQANGAAQTETEDVQSTSEPAAELTELEAKFQESENRYLRLLADFDNFRRRTQLEREAGEKYRAQSLITNLLPAIDNFERAMQVEPDNEQTKALLEGVKMVYGSIIEALKQEGAEQIESMGNEFDPNFHQAVMQTEEEGFGSNIIVEEFQKGYQLKDRVVRPAMVRVNK